MEITVCAKCMKLLHVNNVQIADAIYDSTLFAKKMEYYNKWNIIIGENEYGIIPAWCRKCYDEEKC